jgi:hypothetical protein
VQKALYGTPDAPKIWYQTLFAFLQTIGFQRCGKEWCFFRNEETGVFLVFYVDDGAIGGPPHLVQRVADQLEEKFSIRRLGFPQVFLGINIEHFPGQSTIFIHQQSYIKKLLEKYQLHERHSKVTPMPANTKLDSETCITAEELTTRPYRALIGELLYISVCTRPDISYAVNTLAKHLDRATDQHWELALHVLLYLKGTMLYGLPLGGKGAGTINAYVDADFANDQTDFRSVSGYLVFAGKSLISWSSKKQRTVTLSSTEAEFIALTDVTREVMWLQPIFKFLGYEQIERVTIIFEDNFSLPLI